VLHQPFTPIGVCLIFLILGSAGNYVIKDNLQGAVDTANSLLKNNIRLNVAEPGQLTNFHKIGCSAFALVIAQITYAKLLYPDMQMEISISCIVIFVLSICSDFVSDKFLANGNK
jgi:hypothetical protein